MKASRMAQRLLSPLLLPLLLGQPAQDHVALQRRDVIDEQHAVEVVDLVLQAGGEQPLALDLPSARPSRSR